MKKSVLSQFRVGSAEQVVYHALWQRSRGRRPSMSFIGERNPREALAAAAAIFHEVRQTELIDLLVSSVSQAKGKFYGDMTDAEIGAATREIVRTSSSEDEVRQRIRDELGYSYDVALHTSIPDDKTGVEARELVRGLGGLVMKNGAMAMAMMRGHDGIISL